MAFALVFWVIEVMAKMPAFTIFFGNPNVFSLTSVKYNYYYRYTFIQAAKKALKGAQYAHDSNSVREKKLNDIVEVFKKPELRDWVRELQRLLTSPSYMQYPTEHHQPMIPHEEFSDEIVQRAQVLSQNITGWCKWYIG